MDQRVEEAIEAWLLGTGPGSHEALQQVGAAPGAEALLARLFESFTGSPGGRGEQVDCGAAAKSLTVPNLALSATLTIEVEPVRIRFDGTDPTTLIGLLFPVGTVLTLTGRRTMQAARMIGTAAGALVDVAYWL